jgi:hypothetical protein
MFLMPAPAQQAVVTVNYTHLAVIGADHIAATIAALDERGVEVFDVRGDAERDWTETIVSFSHDATAFMAACTPSRLNFEGHPEFANPRNGSFGRGHGDAFEYQRLLADWLHRGDFAGWDLVIAAEQTS